MKNFHNVLWVIDLPSVSTLSGQPGGLSGGLCLPRAFRRPALASEGIPSPLRVPAFVTVGLLRPPQTASGLPCSAFARRDGGGCPLYSGGVGVVGFALLAAKPRTDSIRSRLHASIPGLSRLPVFLLTEPRRGFTCVHPIRLPLACGFPPTGTSLGRFVDASDHPVARIAGPTGDWPRHWPVGPQALG